MKIYGNLVGFLPRQELDTSAREAIVEQVLEAISQNVIGDVDEANNILITAPLAAGTYTLGYENADGSVTEIGSFTVSGSGG